ncbi:hypothetical protein ES705_37830 [subsurface metagenome]
MPFPSDVLLEEFLTLGYPNKWLCDIGAIPINPQQLSEGHQRQYFLLIFD